MALKVVKRKKKSSDIKDANNELFHDFFARPSIVHLVFKDDERRFAGCNLTEKWVAQKKFLNVW